MWLCPRPSCGECEASWLFCPRCGQPRLTVPLADDLKWLGDYLYELATTLSWSEVALEAWKILVFPRQVSRKDLVSSSVVEDPRSSQKVDKLCSENTSLRREIGIATGERDQCQETVKDLRGRIAILRFVMVTFKGKILATQKALLRVLAGSSVLTGPSSDRDLQTMACEMTVMAAEVESLLATLHDQSHKDLRAENTRILSAISGEDE